MSQTTFLNYFKSNWVLNFLDLWNNIFENFNLFVAKPHESNPWYFVLRHTSHSRPLARTGGKGAEPAGAKVQLYQGVFSMVKGYFAYHTLYLLCVCVFVCVRIIFHIRVINSYNSFYIYVSLISYVILKLYIFKKWIEQKSIKKIEINKIFL